MLNIEDAKKQADILAKYLKTVGKNLKHTHALEAIARIHGHESLKALQDAQSVQRRLADIFASGEVREVSIDGGDYRLVYYDSEALGQTRVDLAQDGCQYSTDSQCIELMPVVEQSVIADRQDSKWLTLGNILSAQPHESWWVLPSGHIVKLYAGGEPITK